MTHVGLKNEVRKSKNFSSAYKLQTFQDWYNLGRPSSAKFHHYIKPDELGDTPSLVTIGHWIQEDFKDRADLLDKQVADEFNKRLIEVKIEMLNRHADVGVELQKRALEELQKIKDLSESGAIRLLELGIKVEQGARGLPEMLNKVMKMKDDELLKEINDLVTSSSQLRIEANNDGEE